MKVRKKRLYTFNSWLFIWQQILLLTSYYYFQFSTVLAIDEVEKSMIIDTLSEIEALGKADAEKIENVRKIF